MLDDLLSLWPWFVAAIGVGAATAAFIGDGPRRRLPARWLVWFSAATVAGVVAVALGAIQGNAARLIAEGVACFIAFLAGASAVGAARGALGAHERWAMGLAPLALLWCAAAVGWPHGAMAPAPLPPVSQATEPPPQGALSDERNADKTGAIPAPAPPSNDPAAILAALPVGDLDAATCQRALDAVAAAEPVFFNPAHATIRRQASGALDKAAEVIRRCPQASIEVIGFDDGDGANAALAVRRARAVERYLRAEGVGGRKLATRAADPHATRPGEGVIGYVLR